MNPYGPTIYWKNGAGVSGQFDGRPTGEQDLERPAFHRALLHLLTDDYNVDLLQPLAVHLVYSNEAGTLYSLDRALAEEA